VTRDRAVELAQAAAKMTGYTYEVYRRDDGDYDTHAHIRGVPLGHNAVAVVAPDGTVVTLGQ
jgi:hypothetical protein